MNSNSSRFWTLRHCGYDTSWSPRRHTRIFTHVGVAAVNRVNMFICPVIARTSTSTFINFFFSMHREQLTVRHTTLIFSLFIVGQDVFHIEYDEYRGMTLASALCGGCPIGNSNAGWIPSRWYCSNAAYNVRIIFEMQSSEAIFFTLELSTVRCPCQSSQSRYK